MELIPVKTTDPYYAEAERLMTDAFPPEERRPLERQRQYTDHNPLFHPQVVVENGTFAGLFNYWTLDGFLYVEHLATCPHLRGGGLGRRILDAFIRQAGQPIVLEVEPPTTDIAARRIGFYRRCGFCLWEHRTYMQPPYAADLSPLPLLLMVHGDLDEEKDFERICHEIHTKVYGWQGGKLEPESPYK